MGNVTFSRNTDARVAGGYYPLFRCLLLHPDVSLPEAMLYGMLHRYAMQGWVTNQSNLASHSGMSQGNIRRLLASLRTKGLIEQSSHGKKTAIVINPPPLVGLSSRNIARAELRDERAELRDERAGLRDSPFKGLVKTILKEEPLRKEAATPPEKLRNSFEGEKSDEGEKATPEDRAAFIAAMDAFLDNPSKGWGDG